ncbi:hypothetical protein SARC_10191 [Sphaeroforma arctica JP610]|uniref:PDZ domain-containing protein n=1 Tax=Sphaeroforma arctica JP610 TaxID=667725 RepID=A0A0L0FMS8_9EUKA|nr:hypothetical protein SARC_10191 [Sphaeroforma arctica JP610]KNC77348.1 hypothetical protein SARC_10191 [Sphaeroforma arctica JP610]|eukprot:XP_014151250.1 hypothetical protein SARC_10191 [Sphaeroforma arctica JP610]
MTYYKRSLNDYGSGAYGSYDHKFADDCYTDDSHCCEFDCNDRVRGEVIVHKQPNSYFGLQFVNMNGRQFVSKVDIDPASAAYRSGLCLGDRVEVANGQTTADIRCLPHMLDQCSAVHLEYTRQPFLKDIEVCWNQDISSVLNEIHQEQWLLIAIEDTCILDLNDTELCARVKKMFKKRETITLKVVYDQMGLKFIDELAYLIAVSDGNLTLKEYLDPTLSVDKPIVQKKSLRYKIFSSLRRCSDKTTNTARTSLRNILNV